MRTNAAYTVERVISNNAIQAKESRSGEEMILTGKGIGFGRKPGMTIEGGDPAIEKIYRMDDPQDRGRYFVASGQIDPDVLEASERIIAMIKEAFGTSDLNKQVYVSLPSHIQFAVHRLREGMQIDNPFRQEIQAMHPREYELAGEAARLIEQAFNVAVPESEVGFLAMHIQSAVFHVSLGSILKYTYLVQELVNAIEAERGTVIPRDGVDYVRLTAHLRFALERIENGRTTPNPFVEQLKTTMPYEYGLAERLAETIGRKLERRVPEDEIGYIAMHLYRLFLRN